MKVSPPSSASLPAHEPQEGAAVSSDRKASGFFGEVEHPPLLQLGSILEARVAQALPSGQILIEINGAVYAAADPGGLEVGQHLRVRVEQLEPEIVLAITDTENVFDSQAARFWRAHLPFRLEAGELLQQLQHQLSEYRQAKAGQLPSAVAKLEALIARFGEAPFTAERIRALITDSGVFYEARLLRAAMEHLDKLQANIDGDLKGVLLGALRELQSDSLSHEITAQITGQLQNIESQQAANLLTQQDHPGFQLQLPLLLGGSESGTVALSVEPDTRKSEPTRFHEHGYTVLFLLNLETFGRMQIEAHLRGKSLSVIFYLGLESSLRVVQTELPSFRETLHALGYENVLLFARALKTIPEDKRAQFDALALGASSKINVLDVKA